MSERKVLNKYYPPDFNPALIPKLRLDKYRQYQIRTMAPFNMRCKTCGEFIYKGKKFNSRKETVKGENYLGLEIYRFYIRCTRCLAEITYKTDPENTDYAIEHGATRNFEAETTARKMEDAKALREQEEMQNPMKILENRTKDSQREMELLETLEELKELNARQSSVDFDALLKQHSDLSKRVETKLSADQEDEILFKEILAEKKARNIRRLDDDDNEESSPNRLHQNVPSTSSAQGNDVKAESEAQEKLNATSILSNTPVAVSRKAFLSKLVQSKSSNSTKNTNITEPGQSKKQPDKLLVSYGDSEASKSEDSDS